MEICPRIYVFQRMTKLKPGVTRRIVDVNDEFRGRRLGNHRAFKHKVLGWNFTVLHLFEVYGPVFQMSIDSAKLPPKVDGRSAPSCAQTPTWTVPIYQQTDQ